MQVEVPAEIPLEDAEAAAEVPGCRVRECSSQPGVQFAELCYSGDCAGRKLPDRCSCRGSSGSSAVAE